MKMKAAEGVSWNEQAGVSFHLCQAFWDTESLFGYLFLSIIFGLFQANATMGLADFG
jgi:hypothetical protein